MCPINEEYLRELLNECDFLLSNIGDGNIIEIENHILVCPECAKSLHDCFESYKKSSFHPYLSDVEIPEGILSEKDFLKKWHSCASRLEEVLETVETDLYNKLQNPDVIREIERLRKREMMAIKMSWSMRDPTISPETRGNTMSSFARNLLHTYKYLFDTLGPKEFSLFMGYNYPDEIQLETILDWWWEKLVGTEIPRPT